MPNIIVAEAPAPTTIASGIELGDSQDNRYWHGSIAEVIGFGDALSTSEREQVQTYLAIKYGISISSDYIASDATTLWDATANATYSNDIAGIGRDDASALEQKQSGADILTVALGALAADNAANANTYSADLSFLLLGHDNGGLTESPVTISATPAQLLGRTWLAAETGTIGSLELQFDLSGLTVTGTEAGDFYLVLDTDTDPTNGTRQTIRASSFAADVVAFTSIDVEDGDYLMLLTYYEGGKTDAPLADGVAASGVLGQGGFNVASANNGGISASRLDGPSFLALGPTGKLFVSDTDNNRVLRWSSVGAATSGSAAEAVLGQANFTASAANRGGTAAANTMFEPHGLFVSSAGVLYVADTRNNRVLRFDNAESAGNGAAADAVLGQADFTSNDPNRLTSPAANSLRWPMDLYVDDSGHLWVSDWANHRVLRYENVAAKANGANADGVLGQDAFTTSTRQWKDLTDADSFVYPSGVCVDENGILWVADSGNSRILRFDNAASKANGDDADGVLGQPDFTSWRTNRGDQNPAVNTLQWPEGGLDVDNNGRLWVADRWGDRVIWFHDAASKANGADADGVIGQPSFTSRDGSVDNKSFNGAHDVLIDENNDYVWVVDNNYNRILRFNGSDTALGKQEAVNLAGMLDFWLIAGQATYADADVTRPAEADDPVFVWLDQGRHQFTALAETPPVFMPDAVNGHPAVHFGASAGRMRIAGGIFGLTSLDRATVWAVIQENADGQEDYALRLQRNFGPARPQAPAKNQSSSASLFLGEIPFTTGAVAELMATFQTPSDREYASVASYLAMKYGLTFEESYLSSAGDTLWHQEKHHPYNHGIAGLGRDDAFDMLQTTSRAASSDAVLTVQLPAADTLTFPEDQSFALWGHNARALAINVSTNLPDAAYRMQRTWHMRKAGAVDTLTISLPAETQAEYLLIDVTDNFSNPTVIPLRHDAAGRVLSANVTFDEAIFLTLAAATPQRGYGAPPAAFVLYQNYPNPFNPTTTIRFDLPQRAHTKLDLYDVLGRHLRVLIDEDMPAGSHSYAFDGSRLASGVYFYRMQVGEEVRMQKMLLTK